MLNFTRRLAFAAFILGITSTCSAGGAKLNYADHVRPIFREHCFNCHNQNKATNDLALDSYERLRKGGASGQAIAPGDLDNSYLYALVTHKDQPYMPPKTDKLSPDKLAVIKQWILDGALKDSGAKADVAKPATKLAISSGAARPVGPAIMPEGLSRQPVVYTPRPGAVTALATSPWAPLAAIAGEKQISLYNTDTAELLGVLPFPDGIPYVLRFSRSGKLLLAGGGKSASRGLAAVYDVHTGKRLFQVGDELDAVLAADINAKQTLIALGGPQKIVRIFSTADGSQVAEIRKHTDWIYAVEFSPDGALLATADRGGGLWVWEAGTDREFYNLEGHKGPVTSLSWRDDSNLLASGSEDGTIKLWGMEQGKQLRSIAAHAEGVTSIHLAHDGRLLSGGRDRQAKIWDAEGKPVRTLEPFSELVMKVAFAHDGARLLAGDWSGEIRLSAAADGKLIEKLASNPPTLDLALQVARDKAAAARVAAERTANEAAAAHKASDEKQQTAARAAAEAAAVAQKAEAAKTVAVQAEAARLAAEKALQRAAVDWAAFAKTQRPPPAAPAAKPAPPGKPAG
jgi:hypothetical protein